MRFFYVKLVFMIHDVNCEYSDIFIFAFILLLHVCRPETRKRDATQNTW